MARAASPSSPGSLVSPHDVAAYFATWHGHLPSRDQAEKALEGPTSDRFQAAVDNGLAASDRGEAAWASVPPLETLVGPPHTVERPPAPGGPTDLAVSPGGGAAGTIQSALQAIDHPPSSDLNDDPFDNVDVSMESGRPASAFHDSSEFPTVARPATVHGLVPAIGPTRGTNRGPIVAGQTAATSVRIAPDVTSVASASATMTGRQPGIDIPVTGRNHIRQALHAFVAPASRGDSRETALSPGDQVGAGGGNAGGYSVDVREPVLPADVLGPVPAFPLTQGPVPTEAFPNFATALAVPGTVPGSAIEGPAAVQGTGVGQSGGDGLDLSKTNDLLQQLLDEVRKARAPFMGTNWRYASALHD
jgi:hypothetical protein